MAVDSIWKGRRRRSPFGCLAAEGTLLLGAATRNRAVMCRLSSVVGKGKGPGRPPGCIPPEGKEVLGTERSRE